MAQFSLSVDTSDCAAVIAEVSRLEERLTWPHRERFRDAVYRLMSEDKAFSFVATRKGSPLEVIASSDLLDLMRDYEST